MSKKIGLGCILGVSILLAACGGSDGDSNTYNPPASNGDPLANGTKYYLVTDNLNLQFLEIQNKKMKYSNSNTPIGSYVLTAQKLYIPRDLATHTIDVKNMSQWTYHVIGDVKLDYTLETVNLSGKNVYDTLFPGYRALSTSDRISLDSRKHSILLSDGSKTFPRGSTCYRYTSSQYNQNAVVFNTNAPSAVSLDFVKDYLTFILDDLNPKFGYSAAQATWQNIPWLSVYDKIGNSLDDASVVRYQGKDYVANLFLDDKITTEKVIAFTEMLIAEQKHATKEEDKAYLRDLELGLAQLKTGCDFYNQTAANVVADVIR